MENKFKTFLLGVYAGFAIALGGLLNIIAKALISNPLASKIVGSLLFPVGLTIVCFFGLNLYTGKIGYLFENDDKKKYFIFLILSYLGNIVGSVIFGLLCYFLFKSTPEITGAITAIANNKTSYSNFSSGLILFAGAIVCGALVYLAVFCFKKLPMIWMKVVGIFLPIALFVFLGNDHCVANMYYFSFGMKFLDWKSYVNIAIATLGNSVGAILLNEAFFVGTLLFSIKKEAK